MEGFPDVVNRAHFGCGIEQDPEQRNGDACDDIWEEERHAEECGASDFEMNHPGEEEGERQDDAPRDDREVDVMSDGGDEVAAALEEVDKVVDANPDRR